MKKINVKDYQIRAHKRYPEDDLRYVAYNLKHKKVVHLSKDISFGKFYSCNCIKWCGESKVDAFSC